MNRRNFVSRIGVASIGATILPTSLMSYSPKVTSLGSFLLPILIGEGASFLIKNVFDSFSSNGHDDPVHKIANSSIEIIGNGNTIVSPKYYDQWEYMKGRIGKESLNGMGVEGEIRDMKNALADYGDKAISPVHAIKNVRTIRAKDWIAFCDLSEMQVGRSGNVYVIPRDNRAEKYKEKYWVEENLAYLLYDPVFYCYGLPIENPQVHYVDDALGRQIKEETGLTTTVKSYKSQKFLFRGENACDNEQDDITRVWYNHDKAISKFHKLQSLDGCGDPTIQCKGGVPQDQHRNLIRN